MTDPTARDLIQRLADELQGWIDAAPVVDPGLEDEGRLIAEARAYLATPEPAAGPTDEERFQSWWYHEGSAPPRVDHDFEEHTKETSRIAWLNGALGSVAAGIGEAPAGGGGVMAGSGRLTHLHHLTAACRNGHD